MARSLKHGAFQGDSQDSLGQSQRSRVACGDVPKEGSDGREPGVSCPRPTASMLLDVLKKAQNHVTVQIRHFEMTRLASLAFGGVEDEKPQAVSVRCRGQRAGVTLLDKPLRKERLQQAREVGGSVHDVPPSWPKARAAARPSNSGVPVT
jgi:hypothetical protein